jgi:WD40 repeat protein
MIRSLPQVMVGFLLTGLSMGMQSTTSGQSPEATTLSGHTDEVLFVAFSPDGKALVSASKDKTFKIWSLRSCKETATIKCDDKPVMSFAFSPDGSTLASGNEKDNTIKVWEVRTGKERATLDAKNDDEFPPGCTAVAFSPDGRILAVGHLDGCINLLDPLTGKELGRLSAKTNVHALTFSSDGATLASGVFGKVTLWDMPTPKKRITLRGHKGNVTAVAFGPEDKVLVSGSWDGSIKVWDLPAAKALATLKVQPEQSDIITCVAVSPNGKLLASGTSFCKTVDLWNLATRKLQATLKGHKRGVACVAFSPDGKILASASQDWTIKLWDVQDLK